MKRFFVLKIKTPRLIVLLMLAGLGGYFVFFKNQAEASPSSTLFFDPSAIVVNSNNTFVLNAKINPGTNQVTGVEMHVNFDPAKVRLVSIAKSDQFPIEVQAAQFNNENGTASIALATGLSNPPVVTTTTAVAVFTFQAVGAGNSNIYPTLDSIIIDAFESTSVLVSTGNTVVTIGNKTYNLDDWKNIANHWLQSLSGESNGDYNGDKAINARDIGIIMHNWK